jgi:dTDP-4-amino-4,6-dideoxygalactose transaminase
MENLLLGRKMIKYVQNKNIDIQCFKKNIKKSESLNHFTNSGPAKKELEDLLHEMLNIDKNKSVLCVSNGTLALHAIKMFIHRSDPNFTWTSPSFTFPSCVVGGFETSLVDIEMGSKTLSMSSIEKSDGCIITSLFGTYPHNLEILLAHAGREGKKVILDVASSPMTTIGGKEHLQLWRLLLWLIAPHKIFGLWRGRFYGSP